MKKLRYLILSIILNIVVFASPCYRAYADAGVISLVVQGGSIGTAGLVAGSAALFPAAVVAGAALASWGIYTHVSEEAEAQGITKTQYLQNTLEEWAVNCGKTTAQVANEIVNQAVVGNNGAIYLSALACDKLAQFGNWLVSQDNYLLNSDISSGEEVPTINLADNINSLYTDYFDFTRLNTHWEFTFNKAVAIVQNSYPSGNQTFHGFYAISNTNFTVSRSPSGTVDVYRDGTSGLYYSNIWGGNFSNSLTFPSVYNFYPLTYVQFLQSVTNWTIEEPSADLTDFSGYIGASNGAIDNINTWSGTDLGVTLDLNLVDQWARQMQQLTDQTGDLVMHVDDYIKSVADVIDNVDAQDRIADQTIVIDNSIVVENPVTGVIEGVDDLPVGWTPVGDITLPEDVPIPGEATEIINPEAEATADTSIPALMVPGLKDVFPFCLPFDVYDMLAKFNTAPVTPEFDVEFTLPIVGTEISYHVDLSPFNTVAAVMRTMELIATIVGLAIATRAIYIRA